MRIKIVSPVLHKEGRGSERTAEQVAAELPSGDEVDQEYIRDGPESIEGEYDEALAVPDTIRVAVEAEREGFDVCVLSCMGDPGLGPIREALSIPVFATSETAMHVASMLGHRFSIVTVLDRVKPVLRDLATRYDLDRSLASVRSVDLGVLDLDGNERETVDRLVEESARAIEADEADVIVFGCTGMVGLVERVEAGLRARGHEVPVLDPTPLTVQVARAIATTGAAHSPEAYPAPDPKHRTNDVLPDVGATTDTPPAED